MESGGAPWSQQIDRVPGDAAQPLTDAEVIAKARLYCRGRLDDARADRLIREVMQGPAGRPVSDLLSA